MPAENRIREWAQDDRADNAGLGAGFAARYARARAIGCERLAEELLLISDDPCLGPDGYVDNGAVQRARLMSDNRRWLLSKLLPRQYGDKVTQEITGEDGGALISRIELIPVAARPRPEADAEAASVGEASVMPLRGGNVSLGLRLQAPRVMTRRTARRGPVATRPATGAEPEPQSR